MGELWGAHTACRNEPMLPKGLVKRFGRKSSERQKGGRMLIENIK